MSRGAAVSAPVGNVLVVDDNDALADNLRELLEDAGYSVEIADSCAAARREPRTPYDVALVDVVLPDGDGLVLARELRDQREDAEVVLLTGHASVESAVAAVQAGARAYLVKPCAPPELLLTVGQAMRQVRMHREKRDLARRAQVAEKLAAVGTLTAGLSHEIRNPLNAAGLQLAIVERRVRRLEAGLQPSLLEPLALVRDEIRRLDHILEDFLQFARPKEFTPQPVSLVDLVRTVGSLLGEDAAQRGVRLETMLEDVPVVAGDEGRLRQVAINLTLNAIEASEGKGHVRLSLRRSGDAVELLIDDAGPGISPEVAARIFEPFFTTKASGSGLGLAIVSAIVVQHGGTIDVGASPLGGARFRVSLPTAS